MQIWTKIWMWVVVSAQTHPVPPRCTETLTETKTQTWRNEMSHQHYQSLQCRSKNENHGTLEILLQTGLVKRFFSVFRNQIKKLIYIWDNTGLCLGSFSSLSLILVRQLAKSDIPSCLGIIMARLNVWCKSHSFCLLIFMKIRSVWSY